ncbi:hypothetical protein, partial [Amphritea sp.]|uniref:hypothetical protein n=1 Tax=Amphritea sp. TaxID=1872502 RepID=UPI003D13D8E9
MLYVFWIAQSGRKFSPANSAKKNFRGLLKKQGFLLQRINSNEDKGSVKNQQRLQGAFGTEK